MGRHAIDALLRQMATAALRAEHGLQSLSATAVHGMPFYTDTIVLDDGRQVFNLPPFSIIVNPNDHSYIEFRIRFEDANANGLEYFTSVIDPVYFALGWDKFGVSSLSYWLLGLPARLGASGNYKSYRLIYRPVCAREDKAMANPNASEEDHDDDEPEDEDEKQAYRERLLNAANAANAERAVWEVRSVLSIMQCHYFF